MSRSESVFGYVCAHPEEETLSIVDKAKAIEKHAEELPGTWGGYLIEAPANAGLSWRERPELKKEIRGLNRGDHLVVARPDEIDRAPSRLAEALAYLARLGIHMHFLHFHGQQLDLPPEAGQAVAFLLAQCVGMYHEAQSDISRESARRRKELGMAVGGSPGYGKRRVKRRHGKCDEWCPKQCAIIRELKLRRDAGEPWEEIAADFHKRRLRTGGNQPWVRKRKWKGQVTYEMSRLYRAYRWYRDLLARDEELGA